MSSVQGARPIEYPVPYSNARPSPGFNWRAAVPVLTAWAWRSLGLFLIIDGLIYYRKLASLMARAGQWYFLQDGIAQFLLGMGVACWLIALGLCVRVLRVAAHRRHTRHAYAKTNTVS